MAVTCKWQTCEMWSLPGAAAVDICLPNRSGRGGRSGDGQMNKRVPRPRMVTRIRMGKILKRLDREDPI